MTTSKFTTTLTALAIVAILGVGTAFAYPGNHMGGYSAFTPEQQTEVQSLYADHDKATAPVLEKLYAKRAELNALSYNKNSDAGKIQALYREIADIEAQLFTADTQLSAKLSEKGLGNYGAGHRGGWGGHRGGWGGHGGGHGGGWGGHGGGHGGGWGGHRGGYGGGYR